MPRNYEYKEVDIQDLLLDEENPRFASSILVQESASQIGQDTIVEHLLRYSNVIELANRINIVGELHGSEMITCIQKGNKYVVLEGNRRTCACKLLLDRTLIPEQYKKKITFITEHTKANISKVMVTIYPNRESVQPYLSDRHITGVKKWSPLEKNNYYMNLFYQYKDVKDVKRHTSDSIAVVTKSIIKYQFFMNVFDILKSKYQDLQIEKIDYLPMVDRFMETLVGNDEEVGLKLELDNEKLIYLCVPEKKDIYDSILLKVGEAFLIRREKRLCEEGEESKILSNEIYAKRDQKKLILDDLRIPGLYELIKQYKGNSETVTLNAGNTNKSNDEQMSNPDNDRTAAGRENDPEHKNANKQNADNSNWKGAGGNKNLPYFFQGLDYHNLDPNDSDSHGISRVCKEIQLFSNRKLVNDFPIAAAFLMRTIIEHSLIYYAKKHKIQGQDKYIWENISNNGKAFKLFKIINNFLNNLPNYIVDTNIREYFINLFRDYDKEINPLNWVVHRTDEYQLPAKDLIDLPRKGLLTLINFLIS